MRDTIDMAREAGLHIPYWGEEEDPKKDPPRWTMVSPLPPLLKAFEALVRADEREKAKHNEEVLMNALWKACGDDGQLVEATIESQGELK
jgi:hypothetical protein